MAQFLIEEACLHALELTEQAAERAADAAAEQQSAIDRARARATRFFGGDD